VSHNSKAAGQLILADIYFPVL